MKEYVTCLPYKVRCFMARYHSVTIDEFQNITGLTDKWDRPTLRRVFNDLVKKGYAIKRLVDGCNVYESISEKESCSIKKIAEAKEFLIAV
jgi:hypothetical protein